MLTLVFSFKVPGKGLGIFFFPSREKKKEVVVPGKRENFFLIEFQAPGFRAELAIGIGVQKRLIDIRN